MTTGELVTPQVQQAAERLRLAGSLRRQCRPIRDLIDEGDVEAAYAVQRHVVALQQISGARLVGRKIGLTSPAVQQQLGVGRPTFGVLLDTMRIEDGSAVSVSRLLQPLIEAEIMLVLGRELDSPDVTAADARAAVSGIGAALEVVDSRIADWDLTIVDTVADNASTGLFVPSAGVQPLGDRDLRRLRMELRRDGVLVSSGVGEESCHGDPLEGLAWLAREAHAHGVPLQAGEVVITGALGPMVPVGEGQSFTATIGDLAPVSVDFRSSAALATGRGDRR